MSGEQGPEIGSRQDAMASRRACAGRAWRRNPRGTAKVAFIVALLAQIGDATLTYLGLQHGFHEANPLIAPLIKMIGAAPALAFGKTYAALGLWFVYRVGWSITLWACAGFIFCTGMLPWCLLLLR